MAKAARSKLEFESAPGTQQVVGAFNFDEDDLPQEPITLPGLHGFSVSARLVSHLEVAQRFANKVKTVDLKLVDLKLYGDWWFLPHHQFDAVIEYGDTDNWMNIKAVSPTRDLTDQRLRARVLRWLWFNSSVLRWAAVHWAG